MTMDLVPSAQKFATTTKISGRATEHANVNQHVNGKELFHLVLDNFDTNPIEQQTQIFTRPHFNKLNDVPCLLIQDLIR